MSPEELRAKVRGMLVGQPKRYSWPKQNYNSGHDQAIHSVLRLLDDWIEAHTKGGDALCVAQDAVTSPRPDTNASPTRDSDAGPSSTLIGEEHRVEPLSVDAPDRVTIPTGGGPSDADKLLRLVMMKTRLCPFGGGKDGERVCCVYGSPGCACDDWFLENDPGRFDVLDEAEGGEDG